jgi:hypothetical protein
MRWEVEGAEASSGVERTISVDAETAEQAETVARLSGMLVSQVRPAGARALTLPSSTASTAIGTTAPPGQLEYGGYRTQPRVPDYAGLRYGAIGLMVFAVISYLAGILSIVTSIGPTIEFARYSRSTVGLIGVVYTLFMSLWPLAVGMILHAMASACTALRDIARNSFVR